jgi:hypothetical protein
MSDYLLWWRTKSRKGVFNRPEEIKRDRPDAAAGAKISTAIYRRKRRCANPAGLETAEIIKSQAFNPIPRELRVE